MPGSEQGYSLQSSAFLAVDYGSGMNIKRISGSVFLIRNSVLYLSVYICIYKNGQPIARGH